MGSNSVQRSSARRASVAPRTNKRWLGLFARQQCDHVGCNADAAEHCGYRDRYERRCPTAGCDEHIQRIGKTVLCQVHAVSVDLSAVVSHLAYAVDWVGRAVDDDIVACLRPVAAARAENLRAEAVHLGVVSPRRIHLWERSWKTDSGSGIGCRVGLGIEGSDPDWIYVRFNTVAISRLATPWATIEYSDPSEYSDKLVESIVGPVREAMALWQKSGEIQLRGSGLHSG